MRTSTLSPFAFTVAITLSPGCSDDGSTSATMGSSTSTTDSGTTATTDVSTTEPTTDATATSTPTSTSTTTSETTTTTTTTTTGSTTTTGVDTDATTTGDDTTTTTTDTTTGDVCMVEDVPDNTEFSYQKTVDIGLQDIQASYYNIAAGELVFFAYTGPGKRVALDGTVLGDVTAPPQVSNTLDGATYDQVNGTALLLDQKCNFAEVDPVTIDVLKLDKIDDVKFQIVTCGGLALGLDGHLYIASSQTDEIVVITRDLQTLVRRFKVDDDGLTNIDGISLIAGSENFLLLSTFDNQAAIIDPFGDIIVPTSTIGEADPPLIGGDMPMIPDASLTVCVNGHVWVCEGLKEFKDGCYVYVPEVEADSCPCVLPR